MDLFHQNGCREIHSGIPASPHPSEEVSLFAGESQPLFDRDASIRSPERAFPPSSARGRGFLLLLLLAGGAALAPGLSILHPLPAMAQSLQGGQLLLDEARLWEYAESLFRAGEYYRAVSEYKRLIHFFPDSPAARAARLRIGEAYLHGGEAGNAIAHIDALLEAPAMKPFRGELHYLRGLGRLELGRGLPYRMREGDIELALRDFRSLPAEWPNRAAALGFVRAMEQPEEIPSKSPWLAAGFSAAIPGAGSFYVGRYAEGSLAFFVNAVFIYAALNAFEKDDDGLGAVLAVGALAFYGGAIYAAANGAHKFNDRARADYLSRKRARFGLTLQPGGLKGILEKRF